MPDPSAIPTMVIRPDTGDDDNGKPKKLSRDDLTKRALALGYSKAGAEGIVRNFMRESKGDTTAIGDDGTSRGLAQWHNDRKAALEAYAKEQKASPDDPDLQFRFFDKEMRDKFPTLRASLIQAKDPNDAEDAFKRIYERPASIMWENSPRLASDRYRFSDYALGEHDGRKGTNLIYMTPQDYLDLSPDFEKTPFTSTSGRALKKSLDRGDEIEAVPTLDMRVDGQTGVVTGQDGRHRALAAQQEGIDAIPVAVRQTGQGQPTEVQGMTGNVVPYDVKPRTWAQSLGDAVIPRAEAAEPTNPYAQWAPKAADGEQNPYAQWAPDKKPEADGMLMSAAKGAAAGLGKTVLGGQELLGKGLEAVGATAPGKWLVDDARKGVENLNQEIAPDQAAHPWATGGGEIAGSMAVPGGVGMKLGTNALRGAAIAGGIQGALEPVGSDESYWGTKAGQVGASAAGNVVGNALLRGAANVVAPTLRRAAQTLLNEGVEMTPGQMAGGAMKRAEDAMASIPILGSAIRAAQRRSIQTFNRAAINRSLADINTQLPPGLNSGHDAIGWAEQQLRDAYNHVLPNMRGVRDPAFVGDLNNIMARAQAQNLPPEYRAQLQHIIQTEILDRFGPTGRIDGDQAQTIGTQLDALINPMLIESNPYVQQLGRYVREAGRALDNMMATHNGALQAAKDRIDAGWAKFKTVQLASTAAGVHPDGTFTPAQLSRSVLARDRSKDKAAFARGDAMMQDLAAAARDVLPQSVPDSGTAERAALMGVLGGAANFEPHTAMALGASALPYLAPVSRLSNSIMDRLAQAPGPGRNALASILRGASGPGGLAAGSLAPGIVGAPGQ